MSGRPAVCLACSRSQPLDAVFSLAIPQDGGPPRWALAPEDLPWPHLAAAAADSYASEGGAPGGAAQVDWAELVPEYGGSLAPLLQGAGRDAHHWEEGGRTPWPCLWALGAGGARGSGSAC